MSKEAPPVVLKPNGATLRVLLAASLTANIGLITVAFAYGGDVALVRDHLRDTERHETDAQKRARVNQIVKDRNGVILERIGYLQAELQEVKAIVTELRRE